MSTQRQPTRKSAEKQRKRFATLDIGLPKATRRLPSPESPSPQVPSGRKSKSLQSHYSSRVNLTKKTRPKPTQTSQKRSTKLQTNDHHHAATESESQVNVEPNTNVEGAFSENSVVGSAAEEEGEPEIDEEEGIDRRSVKGKKVIWAKRDEDSSDSYQLIDKEDGELFSDDYEEEKEEESTQRERKQKKVKFSSMEDAFASFSDSSSIQVFKPARSGEEGKTDGTAAIRNGSNKRAHSEILSKNEKKVKVSKKGRLSEPEVTAPIFQHKTLSSNSFQFSSQSSNSISAKFKNTFSRNNTTDHLDENPHNSSNGFELPMEKTKNIKPTTQQRGSGSKNRPLESDWSPLSKHTLEPIKLAQLLHIFSKTLFPTHEESDRVIIETYKSAKKRLLSKNQIDDNTDLANLVLPKERVSKLRDFFSNQRGRFVAKVYSHTIPTFDLDNPALHNDLDQLKKILKWYRNNFPWINADYENKNNIIEEQPFQNPKFIRVVRASIFMNQNLMKHPEFRHLMRDSIPVATLAFVATAVYHAFDAFEQNIQKRPIPQFSSAIYSKIYDHFFRNIAETYEDPEQKKAIYLACHEAICDESGGESETGLPIFVAKKNRSNTVLSVISP